MDHGSVGGVGALLVALFVLLLHIDVSLIHG
jgi:hypothetical protein